MKLNPYIWLPHLKFTLMTIAVLYPVNPNSVSKKKYYDFISNLPVFIPINPIGKYFINILNKYPVTPYLDSRMSFTKWVQFIFNKIYIKLELPEETFFESLEKYYNEYKTKEEINAENTKLRDKYIKFGIVIAFILFAYFMYNK